MKGILREKSGQCKQKGGEYSVVSPPFLSVGEASEASIFSGQPEGRLPDAFGDLAVSIPAGKR